jgi:hypothetical protein
VIRSALRKVNMTRKAVIEDTVETLSKLPVEKAAEVADFAAFVLKKHEEALLRRGIERLVEESQAFAFLDIEDALYTEDDLKVRFK